MHGLFISFPYTLDVQVENLVSGPVRSESLRLARMDLSALDTLDLAKHERGKTQAYNQGQALFLVKRDSVFPNFDRQKEYLVHPEKPSTNGA